ncbi:MAG: glycosyltransferase family 39 protein [Isosphaeraceae bacterium]
MISQRGRLTISSVLVGLAALAVLLASEPRLAMVWDEGYTLGREARLRTWFRALRDPAAFAVSWQPPALELVQQVGTPPPRREQVDSRAKLIFDPQVVAYFWPFAREEPHGHPPFYAMLGLLGDLLAPGWQELPRARLGPMLLFSLTAGFLWMFLAERWGYWAAVGGVAAWIFQPRLFGHAHYAAYDAVLTSLWVLSIVAFARAIEVSANPRRDIVGWLAIVGFALALGAALATKLTGWFLPVPYLLWTAWTRDRRATRVLLFSLPLACLVLLLLNPPWWTEPVAGLWRFWRSNLTRGRTQPIPVEFLGTIYQTPNESLPWYNTLVWTGMVTPVGFLLLALAGMVRVIRCRRTEPLGLLILCHWLLLIVLRALPHTPGHDGVRMFLPAFGMLALLAGLGGRQLWDWLGRGARVAVVAAVTEGVLSVLVMMPVPLSYFSPLVGGLPGAASLGMEPTYYWDALDGEARAWLRSHTGPSQTIQFATFPTSWFYLRLIGELPRVCSRFDPGRPVWYVVQNRPGAWLPVDRRLVELSTPAFEVRKLGVPLVWVFPYIETERSHRPFQQDRSE